MRAVGCAIAAMSIVLIGEREITRLNKGVYVQYLQSASKIHISVACFKQEANCNGTGPISTFVVVFFKNEKVVMVWI